MKYFFFFCLLSGYLSAQTVFFTEDFETDGNGTRYTSTGEFADDALANGVVVFRDYVGRIENVNGVSTLRGCDSGPLDLETGNNYTNPTGSFFTELKT